MFTRRTTIRIIRAFLISLFSLCIIAYAVWRSFNYARGPSIDIYQPQNGAGIASSTVDIVGKAERIKALKLNGSEISIDEKGNFKQTIIVFPGMNIITLEAKDQFGRSVNDELVLVGLK
jgi:hypothetical protein